MLTAKNRSQRVSSRRANTNYLPLPLLAAAALLGGAPPAALAIDSLSIVSPTVQGTGGAVSATNFGKATFQLCASDPKNPPPANIVMISHLICSDSNTGKQYDMTPPNWGSTGLATNAPKASSCLPTTTRNFQFADFGVKFIPGKTKLNCSDVIIVNDSNNKQITNYGKDGLQFWVNALPKLVPSGNNNTR